MTERRQDTLFSRRRFLQAAGALACLAGGMPLAHAEKARQGRPNIVLIFTDDVGYGDIGIHGSKCIDTPNIDAIGRGGVHFTQGYVTYPACGPSRASLMTGRHNSRFGFNSNPDRVKPTAPGNPLGLPLSEITIAEALKDAGYVTGMVGKWHLGHTFDLHPQEQGFDEFYGFLPSLYRYFDLGNMEPPRSMLRGKERVVEEEYLTYAFAREANNFIERHKEEPFFLYLAFNTPHTPLMDDERPPDDAHITLKGSDDPRVNRRTYVRMVEALDKSVGDVMRTLRDNGLEENTLVFFINDNGGARQTGAYDNYPLRDYKGSLYEGGIRVPYLLQWPAAIEAGQTFDYPVSSTDVFATAVAAAGGQLPGDRVMDSVDLLPYVTSQRAGRPHDTLFWMWNERYYAVRRGDWKMVKRPNAPAELYNVVEDISEEDDRAAEKPELVQELEELWRAWHAELPEPLYVSDPEQMDAWRRRAQAEEG